MSYTCKAVCRYGNAPLSLASFHRTIELYGIGKYPHLLLENENKISSEITLNFGKVLLGQNNTKYLTIINMTDVVERQN